MIGELKLTALKARLAAVGVQAEFIGEGADVETVAVRKSARGQVELEGTVCTYSILQGSEGDIWVVCLSVIVIHDLPTTMYLLYLLCVFFIDTNCSYSNRA
jgi:hypothetical protein